MTSKPLGSDLKCRRIASSCNPDISDVLTHAGCRYAAHGAACETKRRRRGRNNVSFASAGNTESFANKLPSWTSWITAHSTLEYDDVKCCRLDRCHVGVGIPDGCQTIERNQRRLLTNGISKICANTPCIPSYSSI